MLLIMKAIIKDELMMKATSPYVDDIYMNEDILPADEVKNKLESFSSTIKNPMQLKDETLVLGYEVWESTV